MFIAETLNKFPHEVEELSCDEYDRLITYFEWKHQEQKKANEKAKRDAKVRRGR